MKKQSKKNQIKSQLQSFNYSANVTNQTNSTTTLPELFKQAVNSNKDKSIIFINNCSETVVQSYHDLLISAEKILAGLRKLGLSPQDKVILLISNHQELIATFWGCLLGGFVPLIMETPLTYQESHPTLNKLKQIWELLEHPLIITNTQFLGNFPVVYIEELIINKPEQSHYLSQPDDIAFLTLTSGSTGIPKCIQLSHHNIISRGQGTNLLNQHCRDDIILNWLPFDHIGSISDWHIRPLGLGCQLIYVQKEYILGTPLNWLNLIDQYRVTHSWAPNFVYSLINNELSENLPQKWDLSCVSFLLTAGEFINVTNVQLFLEQLKVYQLGNLAIRPAFGMAELGSGITYYQPNDNSSLRFHCIDKTSLQGKIKYTETDNPDRIIFTDLGKPIPGVELRIVNDHGEILPEETIGNLQVKGEVVFTGYYHNSLANQEVFTTDGWFKTGDLGFISQGNLVITGRAKETIIINGINYYSQEIEAVIEEVEGIEPSYTAACAVNLTNQEKIAIFFNCSLETEEKLAKLLKQIRRTVISKLGINPDYLIPVEKQVIPKTEIGKIKRQLLSERFSLGEFNHIIEQVNRLLKTQKSILGKSKLEDIITRIWQNVLSLDLIYLKENFFELGGNSVLLIQLQAQLEEKIKQKIPVSDLFQYPTIESQTNYFKQKNINKNTSSQFIKQSKNNPNSAIAVIGMSCRLPGADNIEKFWHNLSNGIESITFFTDEELLASGIDPHLINNFNYVKARPILKDIELFDAEFFGYTPKEAELLDPQQRLLLECAWESLEDAGYNPFIYQGKIGIYAGAVMNTYLLNNVYPNRNKLDINDSLEVITLDSLGGFQMMVANDKDYLTTRISYKLNLTGPSINVQTACSTSLVAIHLAKQSLINGECDIALAGGVSLQIPQQVGYLYQEGLIVSPDGHCRAFDQSAQGTVFGNGVGLVVLKRLEEAIADRDNIYAVIKGSAINNDGGSKVGYFAPNGEGQGRAVAEAIANAGITADTIGYLETHGTGTLLGDPIEVTGLSQGFRVTSSENQFCPIGSVKTNVGHLQIASGVVGFIKTVLSLHHQKIPPSLHFKQASSQIDFANSPFYVNTQLQDWSSQSYPRRAGVNSLGVGGTNCHIILEEASKEEVNGNEVNGNGDRPLHILTLSAKNEPALQELVQRYQTFLKSHQDINLADLCFTANTGRVHFNNRVAIIAESVQQLQENLAEIAIPEAKIAQKQPITFLFTGQGCQYLNMGRQLYQTQPIFRQVLEQCAEISATYLEESLLNIIFADNEGKLEETLYSQIAIFAVEYSLYQLWKSWGIEPTTLIGHSLGEYVAACVAGVFSLEDAIKLVITRGKLIQSLSQGEMRSIFAPLEKVKEVIKPFKDTAIAAINGNSNITISGDQKSLKKIDKILKIEGIKSKKIKTCHAFHAPIMKKIVADFKQIAAEVSYSLPEIEIISNLTGDFVTIEIATPDYWCEHLYKPVQFVDSIKTIKQKGRQIFIECSSQPILLAMVRSLWDEDQSLFLPSLRPKYTDWEQILDSLAKLYLAGVDIDWENFYAPFEPQKLSLPTYPFQRQRYWLEPLQIKAEKTAKILTSSLKYPLVGERLLSPVKEIIFQSLINLENLTYLKDHCLDQQVVLPGSAYVEMAREAMVQISEFSELNLEDILIQKPLILSENSDKNLQLILNSEGKVWEIYSLSENETWELHCSGKIKENLTKKTETKAVNLEKLTQQLAQFPLSVETHYQNCEKRGLNYGATFQGITQLWGKTGTALAKIELPEILQDTITNYQIHPALLDSCFQVVFSALPTHCQTETYLPIGIESIAIYGQSITLWSYVEIYMENETIPDIFKADLSIFDSQGQTLIEVKGLTSKRTSSNLILKKEEFWHNWTYKLTWHNKTNYQIQEINEIGSWLILNDTSGLGKKLTNFLESKQQKCYLVNPDDDFQIVINNLQLPLIGVVYIWSLDKLELENDIPKDLEKALHLIQTLIKTELTQPPHLWLVTQNCQPVQLNNLTTTVTYSQLTQSCLWGLGKVINLEHPQFNCVCIDLDSNSNGDELCTEIWSGDTENQVAFRNDLRFVARLTPYHLNNFNSQPLRLDISQKGTLENLNWKPIIPHHPHSNQVTIKVRAVGLNFRDLLNVLGIYPGDAGLLGLECTGEIVAKGDKVTNFALGDQVIAVTLGCFSNFVTVDAELVVPKPKHLSFESAVTMPGAFLTAYYTLVHLANLQKGDRILIHSGAGGVGLAAIAIAQKVGAEVFTTASPPKWEFLQSLGIKHIFNSRNLDFAEQILASTENQGVDVILNCLSDEFIPSSLSVLKANGRFVEIGKQNIWDEKQVKQVKPFAQYFVVDLVEVMHQQPALIQQMLSHLLTEYEPLPKQVFPASETLEAFRYMQQAQQIGKIVVSFPQITISSNATYLITGGLGALGLTVADWLVQQGAKYLVLLNRSQVKDSLQPQFETLKRKNAHVLIVQADVGDRQQLEQVISKIDQTLPPLKGIIHAAGLLKDGIIEQQTWQNFQEVCRPKVQGAWNLHQLTLNHDLDFFVMFSSIASQLGSAGQANYAAANAFLDTLAHARQAMGLPALTINWGPWSQVGLAASIEDELAIKGIESIKPTEGLILLEHLLNSQIPQIGVANINWSKYLNDHIKSSLLEDFNQVRPTTEKLIYDQSHTTSPTELIEILQNLVSLEVAKVLGFKNPQSIDYRQGFIELGMDSLNTVELRNRLQTIFNCNLSSTIAFDYPTIESIVCYLSEQLFSKQQNNNLSKINEENLFQLDSIEELSDEEAEALLLAELEKLEQ